MPTLKETLRHDLTEAIRSRDAVRAATLRMALTAVTTEEASGEHHALSDEQVLKLLTKEAKNRREAAEAYAGANRPELAANENAELAVLEAYLPKQLSENEIEAIVRDTVAELGVSGMPAMGQVMKAVTPKVAGRAEGGRVAALVRQALAG